jgi:hypothetical protein
MLEYTPCYSADTGPLGLLPASRPASRENTYGAKYQIPSSQTREKAIWVITLCIKQRRGTPAWICFDSEVEMEAAKGVPAYAQSPNS